MNFDTTSRGSMEILMSSVFMSIRYLLEGVLEWEELQEFKDRFGFLSCAEDSIILKNNYKLCGGWVEELMQEGVKLDKQNIHDYAANFKV
jgi:hypothetical protein